MEQSCTCLNQSCNTNHKSLKWILDQEQKHCRETLLWGEQRAERTSCSSSSSNSPVSAQYSSSRCKSQGNRNALNDKHKPLSVLTKLEIGYRLTNRQTAPGSHTGRQAHRQDRNKQLMTSNPKSFTHLLSNTVHKTHPTLLSTILIVFSPVQLMLCVHTDQSESHYLTSQCAA